MKRLTYPTIVFFLLLSCKKEPVLRAIDSDINIQMWETLGNSGRTFQLRCSTEKIYGCANYHISTVVEKSSNNITIQFNGIEIDNTCFYSLEPANTTINIGALSNGTYRLYIVIAGKKSEGQLIIAPDHYAITMNKQAQLQIINTPLRRVPDNTIWGVIGYHANSTAPLVQSFIDSLTIRGATDRVYPPGNYGHFRINTSAQIDTPENLGYHFTRPFIYSYSHDLSILKSLLKSYGTNHPGATSITLYTASGEIITSYN